jgi:riboflavin biosynthesis pyrimidine reductase
VARRTSRDAHEETGRARRAAPGRASSTCPSGSYSSSVEGLLRGDLAQILTELEHEEGGNILVEGGPAVVRECLRRNLPDDYWFFVMPVVYGKGPRYWGPMDDQTTLNLIETKPGEDKEILLHYEAVR